MPVRQTPPRKRAVRRRDLRQVAVGDLVEAAGLDNRDSSILLLSQARSERETGVASADNDIIVGYIVTRDAERGPEEPVASAVVLDRRVASRGDGTRGYDRREEEYGRE